MDVTCQIHERYWDTTGVKDETHWNWKCLRFLQIDQWPRRPCWANWGAFTIRWVFFHRPWQKENIFTEKYARRKKGWNEEVSPDLKTKWFRWKGQLRNVQVPRSINRECRRTKSIHIRKFADCKQPSLFHRTIVAVETMTGTIKGILKSKSRISKRNTSIARLGLVSGHMAANEVRNVCRALKQRPISSVTIWMDSMVTLYWITNAERPWKVFIAKENRGNHRGNWNQKNLENRKESCGSWK